jgi:hypothetical protein
MRLQDIIMREAPSAYIFESDGTVRRQRDLEDSDDTLKADNAALITASMG